MSNTPLSRKARIYLISISLLAIFVAGLIAFFIATRIEFETRRTVEKAISVQDMGWIGMEIDGAVVRLYGDAPDDEARFRVVESVSQEINIGRIVNDIQAPELDLAQPELSVEIVQNPRMSSIIGLLPKEPSPVELYYALDRANPDVTTLNLVDSLEAPVDPSWEEKMDYLAYIVGQLENVRISATEEKVVVETVVPDEETAQKMKDELLSRAPKGYEIVLDISAPRPLITPFVFAIKSDAEGKEILRCSATDEEDLARIEQAYPNLGEQDFADCKLGLGAPTEKWGLLISQLTTELNPIENYTFTVDDNHASLRYSDQEDQEKVDAVSSRIRSSLPPGFGYDSQKVVTVKSIDELQAEGDSVNFYVEKELGGHVIVQGVVGSEAMKTNVESIAAAEFDSGDIEYDLKIVEGLPSSWERHVFVTISSVGELTKGSATLTEEYLDIKGSIDTDERKDNLLEGLESEIDDLSLQEEITVSQELATAARIEPNECVDRINSVLLEKPVQFEPSSSRISDESNVTIVEISQILYECRTHAFEIGGHTDSKGGEDVNQRISEERAQAVLDAVQAQALDFGKLSARGYGESEPVASNDTEEGRAKNRRIEIRLDLGGSE